MSGSFFNPLGGGDMPADIREELVRQQVVRMSFFEEVVRFLNHADTHTLWILEGMFSIVAGADDDAAKRANYYQGLADGRLQQRQTCESCGVDHRFADSMDRVQPDFREDVGRALKARQEQMDQVVAVEASMTAEKRMDLMLEYRLKPAPEGKTGLVCMDCGYPYPALEDRMASGDPDSCPGCFSKAAHG